MSVILNPSTSLLLVKNIPYIIYLNNNNRTDYNLTIRDTTGLANSQNPITISTINSAVFSDGLNTHIIDKPNGLIQLGFRNSTVWQLQHTSGLVPANSAANTNIINTSTIYINFHSTIYKNVSTLVVENLTTYTTIINQTGIFNINNLSTNGFGLIMKTLNVSSFAIIQQNINVSSFAIFQSSLQAYSLNTSSIYFKSSLSVSSIYTNYFNAISSLQVSDLVQISSIQVQKSTGIVLNISTLTIGNTLSTFSSLNVFGSSIVNNSILITGLMSSLSSLYIGNNLLVTNNIFSYGISSIGNVRILSTLNTRTTVIGGIFSANSSFAITASVNSLYFSTNSISSFGSISSGLSTIVASNFTIDSLSTNLLITQSLNVGSNLIGLSSISTNNLTTSTIQIGGNLNISSLITNNLIVGLSTTIGSSLNVFTTNIIRDLRVNGFLSTIDQLSTNKSYGIGGSSIIGGNLYVNQNISYSSININTVILNSLDVITSSPSIAINASSIFLSNVTNNLFILSTASIILNRNNTFVSTLFSPNLLTTGGKVDYLYTNNIYVGSINHTEKQQFGFFISSPSYFAQGFSTQNISANTLIGGTFTGKHIGDGSLLSNIFLRFDSVSSQSVYIPNLSTDTLYTSTLLTSTLTITKTFNALSSINLPNLSIDREGIPLKISTNQILVRSPSTMIMNNSLWFDMRNRFIGINISTPTVNLDISGTLTYSTIQYSSFQQIDVTSSIYNFINVTTSSLIVNNLSTTNISFSSFTNTNTNVPFSIKSFNTNNISSYTTVSPFLISAYNSSIVLNNFVKIVNSTQKISINSNQADVADPLYSLDITGVTTASSILTSTITIQTFVSPVIVLSSFVLYGNSSPQLSLTNQLLTYKSTIALNNLLYTDYFYNRVGINNSTPQFTLDVRGNAYFSTLEVRNTTMFGGNILYGIQTL